MTSKTCLPKFFTKCMESVSMLLTMLQCCHSTCPWPTTPALCGHSSVPYLSLGSLGAQLETQQYSQMMLIWNLLQTQHQSRPSQGWRFKCRKFFENKLHQWLQRLPQQILSQPMWHSCSGRTVLLPVQFSGSSELNSSQWRAQSMGLADELFNRFSCCCSRTTGLVCLINVQF